MDLCGKWIDCKLSAYPKYAEAKRREKKGKKRDIDGAQPAAKRGRGRGSGYQAQRQSQAQRDIVSAQRGGNLSVRGRRKPRPQQPDEYIDCM